MSDKATRLYEQHFKEAVRAVIKIDSHGSTRRIYRLVGSGRTVIAVENDDFKENRAFITFSKQFRSLHLPVPEIYAEDPDGAAYLQEDLGDRTLFDMLSSLRTADDPFPAKVEACYSEALKILPRFQIEAGRKLDYSVCHKHSSFSSEMMLNDMHYFRDEYLRRVNWQFDQEALNKEFGRFAELLKSADSNFFMYRDFQSRNIMVQEGRLSFIDYQGGCRGPLQYDVASLLYQAAARIPQTFRNKLLEVYLSAAGAYLKLDRDLFLKHFSAFVYLRIMQVLGTYGLRGLHDRKPYFVESIKYALKNLSELYQQDGLPLPMPEFERFIQSIPAIEEVPRLKVKIYSFSYKQEPSVPYNQHGGGYVFDCRCLPNPGREEAYKFKSGLEKSVVEYLEAKGEVQQFFDTVSELVEQAVQAYMTRKFTELSVAFGCTGGQHRSVYLSEKLSRHLSQHYDVDVEVSHLNRINWLRKLTAET
ncbi:MAG: phosphotransferase [Deltaproteobacteria bacterium]|nr:phosphotransferase [Deltaproteobacteria bacterium]